MIFRKRKNSGVSKVNTEGWMMSYADMATILLAMFIVLSTLGKDQTGFNLNKALESVERHRNLFGLPGFLFSSAQPFQLDKVSSRYLTEQAERDPEPGNHPKHRDKIHDLEEQQFQRFLEEMHRQFKVNKLPGLTGTASVDFFEPLGRGPLLNAKANEVVAQVVPALYQKNCQVLIIVWATMPKESAWLRAARQADQLATEIGDTAGLDAEARGRLLPMGQPWPHQNYERPVFSLVITRFAKAI
jgi:hypothetical protein